MGKKIIILITAVILFIAFIIANYFFAFYFAPTAWDFPKPVWVYSGDTVKEQYFKRLHWYEKLAVTTMTYEGGNIQDGKGGIRTEKAELGTTDFITENKVRMESMGHCELNGKDEYWEYYVQTFSFFNIPVSSGVINCNNGLTQ